MSGSSNLFRAALRRPLLAPFRYAIDRLQPGESALIIRDGTAIRIAREGDVCVYCEVPRVPSSEVHLIQDRSA